MQGSSLRIDKWLWAIRLYKSRSLATSACTAGHVRINGQTVKPSRNVQPGDVIVARIAGITRTVRVLAVLSARVGAPLVPRYAEDLTPAEEFQKPREPNFIPIALRPSGTGRPTKRERRQLDHWLE